MELIKVVFTQWGMDKEPPVWRSLTTSSWGLIYPPGEWVKPGLSNSMLFCWDGLDSAIYFHGRPRYEAIYRGIAFWHVEARNSKDLWRLNYPMKDAPDGVIQHYWNNVMSGRSPLSDIRWVYKWRNPVWGIIVVQEVRLTEMVTQDEFDACQAVQVDYDNLDK